MLITLFLPSDQVVARLFADIPLYVIAVNNLPDPAAITTYDGAAYHSSYFSFFSSIFPYKTIEADISNTYTSFYRRLVNFGFSFIFKAGLNELAVQYVSGICPPEMAHLMTKHRKADMTLFLAYEGLI